MQFQLKLKAGCCNLISLLLVVSTLGQPTNIGQSYVPPSPQAASLGVYAAVPVDYYTGVPSISIPLYDIKLTGFEHKLSLSYHSGGIRTNDEASNVGLNWALNAGGVITRTQRHKDDLGTNGFFQVNPVGRPCGDNVDQEPDMFYYNFAGYTGKFIIDYINPTSHFVRQQVKTDLLIEFNKTTKNFKVIDGNGVTYEFDQKEYSNNVCAEISLNETTISAWHLKKITTATGGVVLFEYAVGSARFKSEHTSFSNTKISTFTPSNLFNSGVCAGGIPVQNTELVHYLNNGRTHYRTTTAFQDEVYLTSISYPSGAISFLYSIREDANMEIATGYAKKLIRIDILKGSINGTILKSFDFGYDNYNSGSSLPDNISKRLRLVSIQESDGSTRFPAYSITYNSSVLPDKSLNNDQSFVSPVTKGLIERIYYPTGGYSSFDFEPHYQNMGARIKQSAQYDSRGVVNRRNYEYQGEKSFVSLQTLQGDVTTTGALFNLCMNTEYQVAATFTYVTIYGSTGHQLSGSSSKNLIGYDKIIETYGANAVGGKIEMEYHNQAITIKDNVPADVPNLNGYPKKRDEYANQNGNYYPVSKQIYNYIVYDTKVFPLRKWFKENCTDLTYNYACNSIALQSEEETTFDKDGVASLSNTRQYQYGGISNYHMNPTLITETDSKGNTLTTENQYVLNMTGTPYTNMYFKNLYGQLINQTKKLNGNTVLKKSTQYKDWFNDGKIIMPLTIQRFSNTSGTAVNEIEFKKYDIAGNPLEFVKSDGITTSQIWGHDNQLLIAEVTNALSKDIFHTSFENGDGNTVTGDSKTGLRSKTGVFTKSLTGLTNGKYIYSYWQKVAGVWNFQSSVVTVSVGTFSINLSGQYDEVRFHPVLSQMQTFAYNSVNNLSTICDINNRIKYYNYDGFGRLVLLQDHDKNVIEQFCYYYDGQIGASDNCALIGNLSQTISRARNNCGCQNGSNVTYTIPANTYFASTQAEANAIALQDVNENSQAYSNANGTCTAPPTTTIYASNPTNYNYVVIFTNLCNMTGYTFNVGANIGGTTTSGGVTLGNIPVGTYRVSFDRGTGTGSYRYRINSLSQISSGNYVVIDNVGITAVPNNRVSIMP